MCPAAVKKRCCDLETCLGDGYTSRKNARRVMKRKSLALESGIVEGDNRMIMFGRPMEIEMNPIQQSDGELGVAESRTALSKPTFSRPLHRGSRKRV